MNCVLHNVFQLASINEWSLAQSEEIESKVSNTAQLSLLQINNTAIKIVNNAKNLGVIFNNTLNWSNHINAFYNLYIICVHSYIAELQLSWKIIGIN